MPRKKRRYRIKRVAHVLHEDGMECWGQVWVGRSKSLIQIDTLAPQYEQLRTLLHEHLHHLFPKWSEAKVTRVSTEQALMLWRQKGYLFQSVN